MRRVDWPDEPGWWWVIKSYETQPLEFIRMRGELITSGGSDKSYYDKMGYKYKFVGPIEKPEPPITFSITGSVKVIHCNWSGIDSWKEITITTRDSMPVAMNKSKDFKITFEEIL